MNLLKGKVQRRDGRLHFVENGEKDILVIPFHGSLHNLASRYIDKEIVFGIRPENITNEPKPGAGTPTRMRVAIAEPMGGESLVYFKSGTGNLLARIRGEHLFQLKEDLAIQINVDKVTLFDPDTEKAICYE